jgi:hypothetical protein
VFLQIFHLQGLRCERPRFLGKSTLGFLAFNCITYSLLVLEIVLLAVTTDEEKQAQYVQIFNACYAVLMFIVVVFFLIYGVEVYFKVCVSPFIFKSKYVKLKRDFP